MSKIRVYELAKKMGIPSHLLVDELRALGVEVQSNFSTLDETALEKLGGKKAAAKAGTAAPKKTVAKEEPAAPPKAPAKPSGRILVAQQSIPFPTQAEAPKAAPKPAPKAPAKAPEPPAKPAPAPTETVKPKHHARVLVAQKPSAAPAEPAAQEPAHPAAEPLSGEVQAEPKAEVKDRVEPKAQPAARKVEASAPEEAASAPEAEAPQLKP